MPVSFAIASLQMLPVIVGARRSPGSASKPAISTA